MKHAILGAGAIGGLLGTALASLGEEVTVIVRPEKLAGYPKSLTLERPQGPIRASAKAAAALTEAVDVLWIATKTYQLQTALEVVHTLPACVVPLLNGVDHVEILRTRFGLDRVVPATIAVEAEKIAPGRFLQRSPVVRLNLSACGEPLLGGDHRALGRSWLHPAVHSKRADSAMEQALFPGTFCIGDIRIRHEQGRNSRSR